jgi:hypothetical protein
MWAKSYYDLLQEGHNVRCYSAQGYITAGQYSTFAYQRELTLHRQHDSLYAYQRQQTLC